MPSAGRHPAAVRERLNIVAECLTRTEMEARLALSSDSAMDRLMRRNAPRVQGRDEPRPRLLMLEPSGAPTLEP